MSIFWIVVLSIAVAFFQALLFSFFNHRSLTYERHFSRPSAYEGETIELVEVIRNRKILPVPWLRVESRISAHLKFQGRPLEEHEIDADQYHRSLFFMGPFRQVTRRHTITCLKRGFYQAGSVALTTGDVFGAMTQVRELALRCDLEVYPRLLSDEELDASSTRWQGELAVRRWIMPDPFLMAGIRDYRAGDALRDIHWRATARTGQLQVKVRDHTVDPRVMVILNVQNSEEQWGALMDYEQAGIEAGIRIAASLVMRALSAGAEAGFASNGCLAGDKGTGRTIFVESRRTFDQADVLMSAMARMIIHREVTFPTFLKDMARLTRTDILILTTYESPAISEAIEALTARGNSVTVQRLKRGTQRAEAS